MLFILDKKFPENYMFFIFYILKFIMFLYKKKNANYDIDDYTNAFFSEDKKRLKIWNVIFYNDVLNKYKYLYLLSVRDYL